MEGESDDGKCKPKRRSPIGSVVKTRRGLAFALWPKTRSKLRLDTLSVVAKDSGSLSSGASEPARLEGAVSPRLQQGSSLGESLDEKSKGHKDGGTNQMASDGFDAHMQVCLQQVSSLALSPGSEVHGQERAGYVVPGNMLHQDQIPNQIGGADGPAYQQERSSLAQSPGKIVHGREDAGYEVPERRKEAGYGVPVHGREDTGYEVPEHTLNPNRGRDFDVAYVRAYLEQFRTEQNNTDREEKAAFFAMYGRRPVKATVPNEGARLHMYLDPGEDPQETADYWTLIRKAMAGEESSKEERFRLAHLLLDKGTRDITFAPKAAKIAAAIICRRPQGHDFLCTMLRVCETWYNERDERLPRAMSYSDLFKIREKGPRVRLWIAYVAFLANLMAALTHPDGCPGAVWTPPTLNLFFISVMVCNCLNLMICWPALNVEIEMDVFLWVLSTVGGTAAKVAPTHVKDMISCVCKTVVRPECPPEVRRVLKRVIQLRASGWQLPEEEASAFRARGWS